MKFREISATFVLLLAGLSPLVFGAPAATDAQAAFLKLKGLAGAWDASMPDGSKSQVQYEVVSGASAVVERLVNDKLGSDNAMVAVYYLDGGRLLLQHYCMAKNQPRMLAESFDPSTGELRFAFLDATGLSGPAAGLMHNATFRFIDASHLNQEWQFFEDGKPKFTESMQYIRLR